MGLFFALTLFSFSSILIYLDHYKLFDFNFHFSLTMLGLQITSSLYRFLGISISINHLLFCLLYSLILSLMIFPYFKYLFRTTLNYYSNKGSPFEIQGSKSLSPLYKYTLILPFIISLLWVNIISNTISNIIGDLYWEHIRLLIVLLYSGLRIFHLRSEVQILLDQGKNIIYDIIRNPTDENKKESELQCTAIGAYA